PNLGDPLAGATIAVGINRSRHPLMSMPIAQQLFRMLDNCIASRADDAGEPSLRGLGALGGLTENEYGNPERRRFLLDPSRVRKDQIGPKHVRDKRDITEAG